MSFNKTIQYKKEHRKEYWDSRAFDESCRSHGTCLFCSGNRLYQTNKQKILTDIKLKEYKDSQNE